MLDNVSAGKSHFDLIAACVGNLPADNNEVRIMELVLIDDDKRPCHLHTLIEPDVDQQAILAFLWPILLVLWLDAPFVQVVGEHFGLYGIERV